jgi:hypothetical protein
LNANKHIERLNKGSNELECYKKFIETTEDIIKRASSIKDSE